MHRFIGRNLSQGRTGSRVRARSTQAAPREATGKRSFGVTKSAAIIAGGFVATYGAAKAVALFGDVAGVPDHIRDPIREHIESFDNWISSLLLSRSKPQASHFEPREPSDATRAESALSDAKLDDSPSDVANLDLVSEAQPAVAKVETLGKQETPPVAASELTVASEPPVFVTSSVDPTSVVEESSAVAVHDPSPVVVASPWVSDSPQSESVPAEIVSPAVQTNDQETSNGAVLVAQSSSPAATDLADLRDSLQALQNEYAQVKEILSQQTQLEAARIREVIRQYEANFQRYINDLEQEHSAIERQQSEQYEQRIHELRQEVAAAVGALSVFAKSRHEDRLEIIQYALNGLQTSEQLVDGIERRMHVSQQLAAVSRSCLLLQQHLMDHPSLPFDSLLTPLRTSSQNIPFLMSIIEGIPVEIARSGLPTFDSLAADFDRAASQARRSTLVAPSSSLVDRIGAVLQERFTPEHKKVGLVSGEDNWSKLARANFFMKQGKLEEAVNEVSQLDGPARDLMGPFISKAQATVTVSQRLRLLSVATASALENGLEHTK